MLPVKNRISSKDYSFLKKGFLYHSPLFTLKVYKTDEQKNPKFSVIISKKVAVNATDRNKIKRRIHSVLFDNIKKVKNPYSYVIWVKKEAIKVSHIKIKEEIVSLFKKANLL